MQNISSIFSADILKLLFSLKSDSLINNIKKKLAVNIYNINNNIIVEFYIILKCKFESIWRFAIFLIIFVKVYQLIKSFFVDFVFSLL